MDVKQTRASRRVGGADNQECHRTKDGHQQDDNRPQRLGYGGNPVIPQFKHGIEPQGNPGDQRREGEDDGDAAPEHGHGEIPFLVINGCKYLFNVVIVQIYLLERRLKI